eukprot:2167573-Karenia_brevis.AAC.1
MKRLQFGDTRLEQASKLKVVGAMLAFNADGLEKTENERIPKAREIAKKIRWAKLPYDIRAELLACLSLPR